MAEKDRTAAGVVASDAMIPPAEDENFRRREYPTLPVPPVGHARLWADRGRGAKRHFSAGLGQLGAA